MKTTARPIAVDLFCGAGGMSLGFEQAGFDVVAAVDGDPLHADTYQANFPDCAVLAEDLTELRGSDIREAAGLGSAVIDVVFGGPPCQGFSPGGRLQADDPRNELVLHFARLVRELRPRWFVMENVVGLVQNPGKRTVSRFQRRIARAGYGLKRPPDVLDARDFGVPQQRRRAFVIGWREEVTLGLREELLERPHHGGTPPTVWEAIGDLPNVDDFDEVLTSDVYCGELGPASEYAQVLRGERTDPDDLSQPRNGRVNGLTGCLRTAHTRQTIARFAATDPGTHEPVSRFYRLPRDGVAHTLRAGTGAERGSYTAPRPIHPVHHRCITVREAARLHSFPDWFQFHPTKWHGFRQVGNSVPPLLARQVARVVLAALSSSSVAPRLR